MQRQEHGHGHPADNLETDARWTQEFWDDRYGASEQLWSGHVNAAVAEIAATLTPGKALDVGSGEGGDVLWLAQHGWDATGSDVSRVALARAEARAAELGLGDRTHWEWHDLLKWTPPARFYDLVVAAFMHLPTKQREVVYAALAEAVAPGGSFVVAAHHPSDQGVVPRPDQPDLFFTAEELAGALDPQSWQILIAEARPRSTTHPETGEPVVVHDTVLHARRLG